MKNKIKSRKSGKPGSSASSSSSSSLLPPIGPIWRIKQLQSIIFKCFHSFCDIFFPSIFIPFVVAFPNFIFSFAFDDEVLTQQNFSVQIQSFFSCCLSVTAPCYYRCTLPSRTFLFLFSFPPSYFLFFYSCFSPFLSSFQFDLLLRFDLLLF